MSNRSRQVSLIGVAFAALVFYSSLGLGVGTDVLDSDTLSMVLAWELYLDGIQQDKWWLAVPKPLMMVVDGELYRSLGGEGILVRALLTVVILHCAVFVFVRRIWSWPAALIAVAFLLADRFLLAATFGGNSSVVLAAGLMVSAALLINNESRGLAWLGLAVLALVSMARQEGVFFLLAASVAVPWKWPARSRLLYFALGVALCVLGWGGDGALIRPLTEDGLSSREIAEQNAVLLRQNQLRLTGVVPQDRLSAVVLGFLERYWRPVAWYLLIIPLGCWAWAQRSPRAAGSLGAMLTLPLAYCAALHFWEIPLFQRFLLPTAVAGHIGASAGYIFLWEYAGRASIRGRSWLRLAVAAALVAAWLIAARDLWNTRRGYLAEEARARQSFRQGLSQLQLPEAPGARFLVPAQYHAYFCLATQTDIRQTVQDVAAHAGGGGIEVPAGVDYIIADCRSDLVSRLSGSASVCDHQKVETEIGAGRFRKLWSSADGHFVFRERLPP